MTERAPIVKLRGITKRFSGVTVVDRVDLDLFPGQVHVLAGENGAGKSTLMKVLAGIHAPDEGTIEVADDFQQFGVVGAAAAGIAIVHQELSIAPNLSVADNLAMGREHRNRLGGLSLKKTKEAALQQLDRVGVSIDPRTRAGDLGTGQQQLVEIARAVAADPKVIILDEPTAALSTREVRVLVGIVNELRDRGCAIVYITHRMDEIDALADVVTVLRDGAFVTTLSKDEATPEEIVTRMVGRPIESLFPSRTAEIGEPRLTVRGLTDDRWVGPIDLDVRAGEIVGVAGLVGSGRSEMARMIFGADRAAAGSVTVDGAPVALSNSPIGAVGRGLALVPESRKEQGLVLSRSVLDNVVMASHRQLSRGGIMRRARSVAVAQEQKRSLGIKTSGLDQHVNELSGGNQQKVLLAKWLETKPKVLILDEPTRGVDVGSKADIYQIIETVARNGTAVLVISSELPEVLGLADRVVVMREGALVADLPNERLSEETVMEHAFGLSATGTVRIGKEDVA